MVLLYDTGACTTQELAVLTTDGLRALGTAPGCWSGVTSTGVGRSSHLREDVLRGAVDPGAETVATVFEPGRCPGADRVAESHP